MDFPSLAAPYQIPDEAETVVQFSRFLQAHRNQIQFTEAGREAGLFPYCRHLTTRNCPPAHRHQFFEIILLLEGGLGEVIDGNQVDAGPGDVLFLNHDVTHEVASFKRGSTRELGLAFLPSFVDETLGSGSTNSLLSAFSLVEPFFYLPQRRRFLLTLTDSACRRIAQQWLHLIHLFRAAPGDRAVLHPQFMALLSTLHFEYRIAEGETAKAGPLAAVLAHLREHYLENVTITKLATIAGTSESHFYKLFKKEAGMTVMQYVHSLKIQKAKTFLRSTTLSIERIAEDLAFEDQSYFYRLFKKIVGRTPDGYRKAIAIGNGSPQSSASKRS